MHSLGLCTNSSQHLLRAWVKHPAHPATSASHPPGLSPAFKVQKLLSAGQQPSFILLLPSGFSTELGLHRRGQDRVSQAGLSLGTVSHYLNPERVKSFQPFRRKP